MKTKDILAKIKRRHIVRSQAEFCRYIRKVLLFHGETPIKATFDSAGNCTICGEAGRCTGWHTEDDRGQS